MSTDLQGDLDRWLAPFLDHLGNKTRRLMCQAYIGGLIAPGDRKSIQPMAARYGDISYHRLHHFISEGVWSSLPVEAELWGQADALAGGEKSWLIIDDITLLKQGNGSVGVAPQHVTPLGKPVNCQNMLAVALTSCEVPIMLSLRLMLPDSWTQNEGRMLKAGVPEKFWPSKSKSSIAIEEIDRISASGVRFGYVLAEAGCGLSTPFLQALGARKLCWAVGISSCQKFYPAVLQPGFPAARRGQQRLHLVQDIKLFPAHAILDNAKWRQVRLRWGNKVRLITRIAAMRVCMPYGEVQCGVSSAPQHIPNEEVWLVGEKTSSGERKYYLSNLPADSSIKDVVAAIKARSISKHAHRQLKEELGLDHFEGRSWIGLHRHALMTMIAYAFLQFRLLYDGGNGK
ncbi:IS701 family transposase [Novosphingobium terrae]|uniref:IS701 family transposase n=1 Tax=Novosphingobium terrae TaxID=2726189 RepID=UPI00197DAAC8|nr:IS701 family transposase [Novosphingobium terrae]